jgi:hypothetical protein
MILKRWSVIKEEIKSPWSLCWMRIYSENIWNTLRKKALKLFRFTSRDSFLPMRVSLWDNWICINSLNSKRRENKDCVEGTENVDSGIRASC